MILVDGGDLHADLSYQKGLEEDGYTGNSFVFGVQSNSVTYYNGSSTIANVNYNDWKNTGISATINYVNSLLSNLKP